MTSTTPSGEAADRWRGNAYTDYSYHPIFTRGSGRPRNRADRRTRPGRLRQLQDIHHQHSSTQPSDAGQQDRLRQTRRNHGRDRWERRHPHDSLRRRRHGHVQLRPRSGARSMGLVEHAPHPLEPVRGCLLPPGNPTGAAEGLSGLFRPCQCG